MNALDQFMDELFAPSDMTEDQREAKLRRWAELCKASAMRDHLQRNRRVARCP